MKAFSRMLVAASFLTLAGCGLPGTFYAEPFINSNISGTDFNAHLAKAYQQRAADSAQNDVNWILSGMYAQKGSKAQQGETVLPWDPANYSEAPSSVVGVSPDRSAKYNLPALRQELLSALDNGGRQQRPEACAQAQAHYDWLVDETYQDTPPEPAKEEDKIATEFQRYLSECTGRQAIAPKEAPASANQWVIYFGWDRFDLTSEAKRVITSVAQSAKAAGSSSLNIAGFTDTSGGDAYNQKLSEKRAASVSKQLKANGIGNVQMEGRGEHDLAKPTQDGVREPLNRRAIITLGQ
jgi:outer membrane protein OmpA-like peptidoglycan-associated protein